MGNLKIELRWSGGDAGRIKDYTAGMVRLALDVIVANGTPVVAAMEQATRSIPIVFVVVNDPVEQGLIPSMAYPGATFMFRPADHPYYDAKLKLLATEVLPIEVERVAVDPNAEIESEVARPAAQPGGGLIAPAGYVHVPPKLLALADEVIE